MADQEGLGRGDVDPGLFPRGHGSWSLGQGLRFAHQRQLRQPRKTEGPALMALASEVSAASFPNARWRAGPAL